jgi:hypothetical protein
MNRRTFCAPMTERQGAPGKVCVRESWRQGPNVEGTWRLACSPLRAAGTRVTGRDKTLRLRRQPRPPARPHARAHAPVRHEARLAAEERALPPCGGVTGAPRDDASRRGSGAACASVSCGRSSPRMRTVVGGGRGARAVRLQALRALPALPHRRVAAPAGEPAAHGQAARQRRAAAARRRDARPAPRAARRRGASATVCASRRRPGLSGVCRTGTPRAAARAAADAAHLRGSTPASRMARSVRCVDCAKKASHDAGRASAGSSSHAAFQPSSAAPSGAAAVAMATRRRWMRTPCCCFCGQPARRDSTAAGGTAGRD